MPPRASPYFGLVLNGTLGSRATQDTLNEAASRVTREILKHAHYVEIPNRPGLTMGAPHRFSIEERLSYVRGLADTDIASEPDKQVRYELRKAEANRLRVVPGDPAMFLNLLERAFRSKGLDLPLSGPAFLELYRELHSKGQISIYLTQQDNEIAAGAVILRDRHTQYYWLAATDPAFRSKGASYLLLDEILRDIPSKGPPELDLVGANIPSVAKFKAHFASKTQSYLVLKGFSSSFARLGRRAYQRMLGVKSP